MRAKRGRPANGRSVPAVTWVALLLAFVLLAVLVVRTQGPQLKSLFDRAAPLEEELVVTFVDVGQGDATIVSFPDGRTLLVDAGDYQASEAVEAALCEAGADRIDWLLATHPHADHIGGAADVLSAFDVDEVWMPDVRANTATEEEFLEAVDAEGCDVKTARAGEVIWSGDAGEARLIGPAADEQSEDLNDYSAILLVSYGNIKVLLPADASAALITQACDEADVGRVDVLKVAHHGGTDGTTKELAHRLRPTYAVMSYALDNPYGHPDQRTIDAFVDTRTCLFGTGANGTVVMRTDGANVEVLAERDGAVEEPADAAA